MTKGFWWNAGVEGEITVETEEVEEPMLQRRRTI